MAKTIPTTLALLFLAACRARRPTRCSSTASTWTSSPSRLRPRAGMSMTAVESTYGAPSQRHAAVGGSVVEQPPITRWDYPVVLGVLRARDASFTPSPGGNSALRLRQ